MESCDWRDNWPIATLERLELDFQKDPMEFKLFRDFFNFRVSSNEISDVAKILQEANQHLHLLWNENKTAIGFWSWIKDDVVILWKKQGCDLSTKYELMTYLDIWGKQ